MDRYVEMALEDLGWGSYQKKVFWAVFNAWMLIMISVSSVAIIMYDLRDLTNTLKSYLAASISAGFVLGCYVAGSISDHYGRVFVFKRSIYVTGVGALALALSQSYWAMLVSLIVLGFGGGCDSVIANTVGLEFFPPSKRSRVTLLSVAWSLGSALSYCIALVLVATDFRLMKPWRVIVIFSVLYTAYAILSRATLKETPVFLYNKKRFSEYDKVMNFLSEFNGKYAGQESRIYETLIQPENRPSKEAHGVLSLFKLNYLRTTVTLSFLYFFSSFGYSSLLFFMPIFLPTSSQTETYTIIFIQQLSGIPGKLLATLSVDSTLGRKWTTGLGFGLTGMVLILFINTKDFIPVLLCTSIYYLLVNMGLSSLFTQSQELYDGSIRSTASGFLMGIARVASAVGPVISGILYDIAGLKLAVTVTVVGYIWISLLPTLVRETRPTVLR